MRSRLFRRWRPLAGVVALGIFTFGWSLRGTAEEKSAVDATAGDKVVIVDNQSGGSDALTDPESLEIVVGTDTFLSGRPVSTDVPQIGPRPGTEPLRRTVDGARDVGDPCICDLDCADGDPCTNDTCNIDGRQIIGVCEQDFVGTDTRDCDDSGDVDDLLFCNLGKCDGAGVCVADAGGTPCDDDEYCDEGQGRCEDPGCNAGTGCDDGEFCNGAETCDLDEQCVAGDDPCPGAPCDEETDTCGDPVVGRCCWYVELDEHETCDDTMTLVECDAVPGRWEYGGVCPCPKYSSGWAPPGDFIWNVGPIEQQPCPFYYRVGDDYTLINDAYLHLDEFKFVGGVACTGNADGRVRFDFWTGAEPPIEVGGFFLNFDCPGEAGNHMWTVTLGTPLLIPPIGYVTYQTRAGSTDAAQWLSTDVVDTGNNNPTLLWVNEVRGPHLSPDDPDVMAFELVGTKVPCCYACCDAETGACTVETPWDCALGEGTSLYLDGITTCDPNPCSDGACCLANGDCILTLGPGACAGEWQGYGTDCDPNCCQQPVFQGGDDCDSAVPHVIVIPTSDGCDFDTDCNVGAGEYCVGSTGTGTLDGVCTVQITISGDNTDATVGDCNPSSSGVDRGWYEAFDLVGDCARVTIDECCTDPEPGASYIIVIQDCSEALANCGGSVFCDEYGWAPFCGSDDANMWNLWETLRGGIYHYPILSDDTEYPGCLRPYQVHITVQACYEFACCLPPLEEGTPAVRCAAVECMEKNALDCEEAGGWLKADTPECLLGDLECALGACCTEPGVCVDNDNVGISCEACLTLPNGDYFGGARCIDDPCPVCPFLTEPGVTPDHCIYDEQGNYIVYIDRSAAEPGQPYPRNADDFRAAESGQIDRICWMPCFFDGYNELECYEDPPAEIDQFWQVVFYEDDFGIPGTIIAGPEIVIPDVQAWRGANSRCWEYSAPLAAGPVVEVDHCYWIEITGKGSQTGCQVYWATNGDGNHYSVFDAGGTWGPEDVTFVVGGGTTAAPYDEFIDLSFCVDLEIAATTPGGCGDIPGACIECGEEGPECDATELNHDQCRDVYGPMLDPEGVAFFPYETCATVVVPPPPANDDCDPDAIVIHDGAPGDLCPAFPCEFEFDNTCADTDGPDPECDTDFGADVWFELHMGADECGYLTIDTCDGSYDGIISFHGQACGVSGCPTDSTEMQCCADDSCGSTGGMPIIPDPLTADEIFVCNNQKFLIRMGGWAGSFGHGVMKIFFEPVPGACDIPPCSECSAAPEPPMAEDCATIVPGTRCNDGSPCDTDADCRDESVCIHPPGAPADPGVCYVPKIRYLSIAANPDQAPFTARRVKLDDGTILGWVGTPVPDGTDGFGTYMIAPLVTDPGAAFYAPAWDEVVHVYGCKIAHASLSDITEAHCDPNIVTGETCVAHPYHIQAIVLGSDIADEGSYSEALVLPTTRMWGDVVGQCPGNVCRPPNHIMSLDDILSEINYFGNPMAVPGVAPMPWLDLAPSNTVQSPSHTIGLGDILAVINGYSGGQYAGYGPKGACP